VIILDTNVVSELLRPISNPQAIVWLDSQPATTLYLTAITIAELRSGVALMPHGKRRHSIESRLEGDVLPRFSGQVLAFDESCTRAYASVQLISRTRGVAVAPMDACIAAIALTRDCSVATRDVTPFHAVGVQVINPFAGRH